MQSVIIEDYEPEATEPAIKGSTTDVITSLQQAIFQKSAAEMLDSVLQLTTQTVKSLNKISKIEKNSFIWTIIIELCSISGILFQLKQLIQDRTSKHQRRSTTKMLCANLGPLEQYETNLELLASKYAPNVSLKAAGKTSRALEGKINAVEIKTTIERQKAVFVAALKNDSKCVTV